VTSLSGLDYIGGAAAGTDDIWVQAYNGTWSGWQLAAITDEGGIHNESASELSSYGDGGTSLMDPPVASRDAGSLMPADDWSRNAFGGLRAFNQRPDAETTAVSANGFQPQIFWNQALADQAQWMFVPDGSGHSGMANFGEHDELPSASSQQNASPFASLLFSHTRG